MKSFRSKLPAFRLDGAPYGELTEGVFCKGGGSNTNTIQKSDPWGPAQPYLKDVLAQSQSLYNKGPIYASDQNPLADQSAQTLDAYNSLLHPSWASSMIPGMAQSGMATATNTGAANKYAQFSAAGGGGSGGAGGGGGDFVTPGVAHAKANATNYSTGTAGVDAATRLQAILNGTDDPTFKAYMASSNQNAADQIMRNKLIPQTVDQLISGGYGGSSTQNIGRAAAVDIADTVGRNNNQLILDHQGKQLEAANIVRGAQSDATQGDIGIYNAGVAGASVNQRAAEAAANNATANRDTNLRALIAGDQLNLDQARLGAQLAPLYDNLQYADANRRLAVGKEIDNRAQVGRDAGIRNEMFNKQAGWTNLGNYANLVNSTSGSGGTVSTSGGGGGTSPLSGALGGAAGAAGLIGMTGGLGTAAGAGTAATAGWAGAGAAMGPVGWAAIGAGALLGSGVLG
jgi:hypothetical protein